MKVNEFLTVLPEMVTFVRVAESGGFSAAAGALHMTPSAVSRHVSKLEKALGVQLIRRTTRRFQLTEAGDEAFERCRVIVLAAQDTFQIAQRHMGRPQGKLRLSAPKAFAMHLLQPHLLEFLTLFPEVDVQVIVTNKRVDPILDGVDLAFEVTDSPSEGMASRKLMMVEQVICGSPGYLNHASAVREPHDLTNHSCVYSGETADDNIWRFTKNEHTQEVVAKGRFAANHSDMLLDAVIAGIGVGSIPDFVARAALRDGRVKRILADWTVQSNCQGTAHILYLPNRYLAPKCRVLIDFLVDRLSSPISTS